MLERLAWWLLFRIIRFYESRYTDQWTKFRYKTEYGTVYVGILRSDPYPTSYDLVDDRGRAIHEFVSGSRELIHHVQRIWPGRADALLSGPASEIVHFLNANTKTQVDGKAPLSFHYWLPALREMPARHDTRTDDV